MTRFRICAGLLVLAGLLAGGTPLAAQVDTTKPIQIKTLKTKLATFKGEVMNATPAAITVRSQENQRVIRTFTYSPGVRGKMQQLLDRGGYQYGDKVEIRYEPGSDVALRIKGKPSKPL